MLLVINPNTSVSITRALQKAIERSPPKGYEIAYFTPISGVDSINDDETAKQSRDACIAELVGTDILEQAEAILVCCFRDHPLIPALKEHVAVPVVGMFHAGIATALLHDGPFGIVATGSGPKPNLIKSVDELLGAQSSRYVGPKTTGLGVVELQEGDQVKVKRQMQDTARYLIQKGARTLVLGCAGMSGMEQWLMDVGTEEGVQVKVIDAARAGVGILTTLVAIA
jgi:Asp/Glu/hydantoin racemase